MSRFLPLLLVSALSVVSASSNDPLMFQFRPAQYHAYRNDPPPPLTLTLHLQNPSAKPVTLKCLSTGTPILKKWTVYQNGNSVNKDEDLGQMQPVGEAPRCQRVGEVLTLPAGAKYTYTRALGPQKVGAQVEYRAGWNVSLRPGSSWLSRAYASALVVPQDRPIPTPNLRAYEAALHASRARWDSVGRGTGRLSVQLADEVSRQAFLGELKKRGLDAGFVDIRVNGPVQFPDRQPSADLKPTLTVKPDAKGYALTLTVTNTGKAVQDFWFHSCDPYAVQRVQGDLTVWQRGGICTTEGNSMGQLKPGESHTRTLHWDGKNSIGQRVGPGKYRARVALGNVVGETVFEVR
ncbi:MAG: hypothetical protein Q4C67_07820 [Deinococcus sp.]|nr:hypothetical protein [Deinococcus sp.]